MRLSPENKYNFFKKVTTRFNLLKPTNTFEWPWPEVSDTYINNNLSSFLTTNSKSSWSLYLHVPFCHRFRCSYCPYFSWTEHTEADRSSYVSYLVSQIDFFAPNFTKQPMSSMSIGGGTPSTLSPLLLDKLTSAVHQSFTFLPDAELNCELAFTTANGDHLRVLKNNGFNRLSLGLQSSNPEILSRSTREATSLCDMKKLICTAHELKFRSVNLDLLLGLSGESDDDVRQSVITAIDTGADELTVYVYRPSNPSVLDTETYHNNTISKRISIVESVTKQYGFKRFAGTFKTDFHRFARDGLDAPQLKYRVSRSDTLDSATLGLGISAESYWGRFSAKCYGSGNTFNQSVTTWRAHEATQHQEKQLWVINTLFRNNDTVILDDYRKLFSSEFSADFSEEIFELTSLKKGILQHDYFMVLASDRLEAAILRKFFWHQDYLKQLYDLI